MQVDDGHSTCLHTLSAHTETVRNLVVKNSDTVISSGNSTDPDFPIKVWDVSSGTCIHTLIGHGETVLCMVLDGNRLVTGSKDGTIKIWDLSTGQCQHTLEGHSHEVWKVALCEDGRIVSGDVQGEVKVWDHQNGYVEVHTLDRWHCHTETKLKTSDRILPPLRATMT